MDAKAEMMRCAMCGYEFAQSELTCHAACPLGVHCMVVCCPRCGYSTVDPARSGLTRRVMRLFRRGKGSTGSAPVQRTVSLLDLKPGQGGYISEIGEGAGGETGLFAHLSQYGLLPGTPVRLAQKRPVPIVQIGETDLALDQAVAAEISVDV